MHRNRGPKEQQDYETVVERIFDLPDGELRVVSLRGGDPRNTASAFLYATARKM